MEGEDDGAGGGGGVEGMKFYEDVISKNFFLAGHE